MLCIKKLTFRPSKAVKLNLAVKTQIGSKELQKKIYFSHDYGTAIKITYQNSQLNQITDSRHKFYYLQLS